MAAERPTGEPRQLDQHRELVHRPGMRSRSLVGARDGVHEVFVEDVVYEPGSVVPLHHHPIVEAFVVLEGAMTVRLGDDTTVVEADHTVSIPPGMPHALANRGDVTARALTVAPWDHTTFFAEATTYLEGTPRE